MLHFFRLFHGKWHKISSVLIVFAIQLSFGSGWAAVNTPAALKQWANYGGLSAINTGLQIVSLDTGQIVYQHNPSKALVPASNMKLVTSAAALVMLKPEFQYRTDVYTDGYQENSVLKGNLILKGYGDPDLKDVDLFGLARNLYFRGIEKVEGNLWVDDTYFDQERQGQGWKSTYGAAAYSAPISALSLNRNTVKVWVRPSTSQQLAHVALEPSTEFFRVENQARTTGGHTRLNIVRVLDKNGKNLIKISGTINYRANPSAEIINLDQPSLYAGAVFKEMLRKAGIIVMGKVQVGKQPENAVLLAQHESRPLRDMIGELNKHSVNLIAENLLKTLGAVYLGAPGSAKKGAQVIQKEFLQTKVGLSGNNGIIIADGSGLSPLNRLTAHGLTSILKYMYAQYDVSADYVSSLAISGVDGTLRKRFRDPQLVRRVRAKTGFINGASTLSGYIYAPNNEVFAFSFLMNHFQNYSAAIFAQEKLCLELIKAN